MGINKLYSILKKRGIEGYVLPPRIFLENKIIAIDLPGILYKYKAEGDNLLSSLITFLCNLVSHGARPLIIFEGKSPPEKFREHKKRKKDRDRKQERIDILQDAIASFLSGRITEQSEAEQAEKVLNDIIVKDTEFEKIEGFTIDRNYIFANLYKCEQELEKRKKQMISITSLEMENVKKLLEFLKIPYFTSPQEAETLCCYLVENSIADAVLSADSDCLAYGAFCVIRDLKFNSVHVYYPPAIHSELGISKEMFTDLCILCGSDYNDKIPGIGEDSILDVITEHSQIENLPETCSYVTPTGKTRTVKLTKEKIDELNFSRVREIFSYSDLRKCQDFEKLVEEIRNSMEKKDLEKFEKLDSEFLEFLDSISCSKMSHIISSVFVLGSSGNSGESNIMMSAFDNSSITEDIRSIAAACRNV